MALTPATHTHGHIWNWIKTIEKTPIEYCACRHLGDMDYLFMVIAVWLYLKDPQSIKAAAQSSNNIMDKFAQFPFLAAHLSCSLSRFCHISIFSKWLFFGFFVLLKDDTLFIWNHHCCRYWWMLDEWNLFQKFGSMFFFLQTNKKKVLDLGFSVFFPFHLDSRSDSGTL